MAGVVLGKLGAEEKILHERKEPIRDVFPPRHSAPQRAAAENPRRKYTWIKAARDRRRHCRDELGCVLIVRMNHDDNACSGSKREALASLLLRPVAQVDRMRPPPARYPACARSRPCHRDRRQHGDDKIDNPLRPSPLHKSATTCAPRYRLASRQ